MSRKQVRLLPTNFIFEGRVMLLGVLFAGLALTVAVAQAWWVAVANEAKPRSTGLATASLIQSLPSSSKPEAIRASTCETEWSCKLLTLTKQKQAPSMQGGVLILRHRPMQGNCSRVFESPAATELIGACDFDADDHRDLIAARIGSNALWFFAGDGRGSFAEPKQITLPGIVTALEVGEINRRDGLADIVVAVSAARAQLDRG